MQYTCVYPNCDEQFISQKDFRYHANCHSSGLQYCGPCKQFIKRLDKHTATQAHITAVAGAGIYFPLFSWLLYLTTFI